MQGTLPHVRIWMAAAVFLSAGLVSRTAFAMAPVEQLGFECQAGKATSCRRLAEIAKNDSDWSVRYAAVNRLTDQAVLAEIARTDKDAGVRRFAVGRLTDQATLAEIAENDKDVDVRLDAVKRLTNQAVLAAIAENDKNMYVRQDAVWRLTDQVVLAAIAKNNKDSNMRKTAVEKLTDQAVLAAIAKNDKDDVRLDAVERLTDQAVLAELAKHDKDSNMRWRAVKRLADPTLLAHIAENDDNVGVRRDAATRIAELAKNDTDPYVRTAAVDKLSDRVILAEIAKNDSDSNVRGTAARRLTATSGWALLLKQVFRFLASLVIAAATLWLMKRLSKRLKKPWVRAAYLALLVANLAMFFSAWPGVLDILIFVVAALVMFSAAAPLISKHETQDISRTSISFFKEWVTYRVLGEEEALKRGHSRAVIAVLILQVTNVLHLVHALGATLRS
jgi:hypothetical protein